MDLSSSSSLRSSPFSLHEFGELVSSALDSDRFTDPLLSFYPPLSSRSRPTPKMAKNPPSPRQILHSLKRRVSALVVRPPDKDSSPALPLPVVRIADYSPRSMAVSSTDVLQSGSSSNESDFAPYLPLATRYELASPYPATSTLTPALQADSLSRAISILSLQASPSLTPPSPSRSCSSAASGSMMPLTPLVFPESQLLDRGRSWSISTMGSDNDGQTGDDPFAKGSVQVVHGSQDDRSLKARRLPAPRSKTSRAPISPPPACPLPSPPCSESVYTQQSEEVDWTLYLGTLVHPSQAIDPQGDDAPDGQMVKRTRKRMEKPKPDWTLSLPLSEPISPPSWLRTPPTPTRHRSPSPPRTPSRPRVKFDDSASLAPTIDINPESWPKPPSNFPPIRVPISSNPPPYSSLSRPRHTQAHDLARRPSGSPSPLPSRRKSPRAEGGSPSCRGIEREDSMDPVGACKAPEYRKEVRYGDWVDFEESDEESDAGVVARTTEEQEVDDDTESIVSGIYYSARSSFS